jgi:cyclopropane-fatty-acyl-phospholipid synthase
MNARARIAAFLSGTGLTLNGPAPYDPHIHDERVYRRVAMWGSLGLGDSYVDGWWDARELDVFITKIVGRDAEYTFGSTINLLAALRDKLLNLQSVQRAFRVAEHHYDLGNTLYEHMLGESMGYSSGYYRNGARNLTEAQYAKFDLVCTTLGLQKGMKVLEIGCGWGTFAAYAAEKYGVEVLGVTVSKEQLEFAQKRCAGLPVTFYFGDYRTLPSMYEGTYDRVVSIEMVEAVGIRNLGAYMDVARRALTPQGMFLMQAIIGSGEPDPWISTRIFPNGVLPTMMQLARASEGRFRISRVESFGTDYDKTLMAWDERFRAAWPAIQQLKNASGAPLYDERFYRLWRYYLMVCAGLFRSQKITVSHLLFTKEGVRATH